MSAKKVRVEFTDAAGQPVAGVNVKVTGCGELTTAPNGQAFFLVEDENFAVLVNGKEIHQAQLASVPDMLRFKQAGDGWAL